MCPFCVQRKLSPRAHLIHNYEMKSSNDYIREAVESISMAISRQFEEHAELHRPEPLSPFILEAIEQAKKDGVSRLFRIKEAAEILGVSSYYIYNKISKGELGVVELGDTKHKQRISAIALQQFIDDRSYNTGK